MTNLNKNTETAKFTLKISESKEHQIKIDFKNLKNEIPCRLKITEAFKLKNLKLC